MNIRYRIKKILKHPIAIVIVALLARGFLSTLSATMRFQVKGREHVDALQGSAIVCFWHGRLVMMPYITDRKRRINLLSSQHSDGKLIAQIQKGYNTNIIYGSSSKGGFLALREFFRAKKRGEIIAITPDGPRGPARKVAGLIIEIAKKLDIPIIPVTFSCNKYKTVRSWDSMMVPKPFSKGLFIIGKPVKYETVAELEDALNKITDEADSAFKTL